MASPVVHYTDGRNAWRLGVGGIFLRYRGLLAVSALPLPLVGSIPFWWQSDVLPEFGNRYILWGCLGVWLTVLCYMLLKYLRGRTIRSLDIKYHLHRLAHTIRDNQTKLHEDLAGTQKAHSERDAQLEDTLTEICNSASEYFELMTGDPSIGASIRLAALEWDGNSGKNNIVFKTVARSRFYSLNRKKSSQPIKITEGIPLFLQDKQSQGVLIYYNLQEAARLGMFKPSPNDATFRSEITTMMVAPINAWNGSQQSLIGIMFVTSKRRNAFEVSHVDSMLFLADLCAITITHITEHIRLKGM